MESQSFHYAKISGILLFITLLGIISGLSFALILSGELVYRVFISVAIAFCAFILYYLLDTWLMPAFRNEPLLTIDDKSLALRNKYPITWAEIDTIEYKVTAGRYGNISAIGIRLKDIDEFINRQSAVGRGKRIKFNWRLSGYHFSIPTTQVKEVGLYNVLCDYLARFGRN